MKKKDLERFKQKLLEEKARILTHSEKNKEEGLTVKVEDLVDETDMASSELNQNLTLRLKDRERLLLRKIELALEKINDGVYGFCEECGEEIELKRLEARPVAELCIRCKEAQEKKEKIYA